MILPRPRSISGVLNLLILIAVLPIVGIIVHSSIEQRQHHIDDAKREVMLITRSMAEVLSNITDSVKQTLITLASIEAIGTVQVDAASAVIRAICTQNPRILSMSLTSPEGKVLAASKPFAPGLSLADRRHVQQAVATGRFAAGEYIVTRIGETRASFSYAYPVLAPDGSVAAVLTAVLYLDSVSGFLDLSSLPEGSFMALTDHQGLRVLYYPPSETNPIGTKIRAPVWEVARNTNGALLFKREGSDGVERIFAVEPLRLAPDEAPYLYAWAGIPEKLVLAPVNRTLSRNLLLAGLVTLLAMAAARLLGDLAFVKPIRRLVAVTGRLADGDLTARSGLRRGNGEIGVLAAAFDRMGDSLQQNRNRLQQQQVHLEEAQRIAHIGSWEWNSSTDRFAWSKELYHILARDQSAPPPSLAGCLEHFTGESLEQLRTAMSYALATGNDFELELPCVRADTTPCWLIIRGEKSGEATLRGTVLDISARKHAESERQALQEQLLHAQKLESIGRLAGGVAHDFNNMLGVILGYTELSLDKLPHAHPVRSHLQEVQTAAGRSRDLVSKLLAFARRQTATPHLLDLNQTISSLLTMLQRMIGEEIELVFKPAAQLWPVVIDPGQVDQLLANLCVNARDAISGSGHITIETDNVTVQEPRVCGPEVCSPGDYVQLRISDTGCGMDTDTQRQIFDPFFTTKAVGKGTGLGLSTVFGIIKQNNGFINVASSPAHGTTFTIFLPRNREKTDDVRT